MQALSFGLAAALAWGVHDICVRFVSQRTGVLPALLTVLIAGAALLTPVAWATGGWRDLTATSTAMSLAAGVVFTLGGYGLYRAFAIGPVRLVAPIMGAYPVLSVGWSVAQGQAVAPDQWLAVLAIIAGVAMVASLSDNDAAAGGNRRAAILWSLAAGIGFAVTFALGQAAAAGGPGLAATLVSRLAAIATALGLIALLRGEARGSGGPPWLLLMAMGALDAGALGFVMLAGDLPNPEYAAVASSVFGMITVILAWAFLKEPMSPAQWLSVATVFAGIAWLAL